MICAQVLGLIDCDRPQPTFEPVRLKDVGAADATTCVEINQCVGCTR